MLVILSVQQKYIMEILRKLGYVRRGQVQALVRGKFPEIEISDLRMDTMLRQLRHATTDVRIDNTAIWLGDAKPDLRRLEAADIMLELAEGRPLDFSTTVKTPEILRFTLEGNSLRLFTVAVISDPLAQAVDRPGRTVWISENGTAPPGLSLPPKHFFAARQPDGSHRFYGS